MAAARRPRSLRVVGRGILAMVRMRRAAAAWAEKRIMEERLLAVVELKLALRAQEVADMKQAAAAQARVKAAEREKERVTAKAKAAVKERALLKSPAAGGNNTTDVSGTVNSAVGVARKKSLSGKMVGRRSVVV